MDRASKLVVFGWCCLTAVAIVYFSRAPWPAMTFWAAGSFAVMALLTAVDRRAVGLVLLFTCVYPIIIRTVTGLNYSPFSVVWTAGLLGALAPDVVRSGWHVPLRFRAALVTWALTVVAGTFIVVLREFDFTWSTVWLTTVANSSAGGWPSFVVTWSLHTSLVLLSGLLWFDWLCGSSHGDFRVGVAFPLASSVAVMIAVAMYQMFVDVTVLNPTVYATLDRASGTTMDANLCGTIAGLWIGGSTLLGAERRPSYRVPLLVLGILACWLAVWASGSRTGFGIAVIVSVFVGRVLMRTAGIRTAAAGIIGAVAVIAVIAFYSTGRVVGPLERIKGMVPGFDLQSLRGAASELWHRNGYGTIGNAVIRDYPVFGIGVGGFHVMQADFARLHQLPGLVPDNAQNWYRQQVAELGIVGSVGWLAWMALFGWFVIRRRPADNPMLPVAQGMLLGVVAVSLVGIPTQEVPAAITFWTAAFWYVSLADASAAAREIPRSGRVALWLFLGVFVAGVVWLAVTSLRVPVRAQRVGWPYSYGFYHPERSGSSPGPGWTFRRSVAVVQPSKKWLALTVSADYRRLSPLFTDAAGRSLTRPTEVRLWCNGRLIVNENIMTTAPITRIVRAPPDRGWVMLESRVSDVVSLRSLGLDDDRAVGVHLDWLSIDEVSGQPNPTDCGAEYVTVVPSRGSATGG